jgi:hypothetical protein
MLLDSIPKADLQVFQLEWRGVLPTLDGEHEGDDAILTAVSGKSPPKRHKGSPSEGVSTWNSVRQVVAPVALAILVVWMNATAHQQ